MDKQHFIIRRAKVGFVQGGMSAEALVAWMNAEQADKGVWGGGKQ